MKRSRFTEQQIFARLKEADAPAPASLSLLNIPPRIHATGEDGSPNGTLDKLPGPGERSRWRQRFLTVRWVTRR